jgi:c-di-GMP phosphodiesterase Gmr
MESISVRNLPVVETSGTPSEGEGVAHPLYSVGMTQ